MAIQMHLFINNDGVVQHNIQCMRKIVRIKIQLIKLDIYLISKFYRSAVIGCKQIHIASGVVSTFCD